MKSLLRSWVGCSLVGRGSKMAEHMARAPLGALARILLDAHGALRPGTRADGAARVEVAAVRRIVRVGRIAELEVGRDRASERRHGVEKRARVGVLRIGDELLGRP